MIHIMQIDVLYSLNGFMTILLIEYIVIVHFVPDLYLVILISFLVKFSTRIFIA
jgi:hypothetical protein